MSNGKVTQLNYAVEQRLRFLEFLVDHYDCVGRSHLVDYFGISEPQATRDFRAYKELAPNNLLLNQVSKKYIKSDTFERIF